MSKIIFNAFQIRQLEKNPNVAKVSERSITYSRSFKVKAVKENLSGKGPTEIFVENGFDLDMIGRGKPQSCLKRWRKVYKQWGEEGFTEERRGKGSPGRPKKKEMTKDEQLKKAEARIAFLEAELEFLKKLDELERQAMGRKR